MSQLHNQAPHPPGLAVILIGDDPASQVYVHHKARACADCGIYSETHRISSDQSETHVLELIHRLNTSENIDGILLQLPLPKGWDSEKLLLAISPNKDVDGLHLQNQGLLYVQKARFIPCTPKGIMKILNTFQIPLEGSKVLVIGRSALVGRPIATLLTQANATVTIAHSKTRDLKDLTGSHDIIVVAAGKPQMIKSDWVQPNTTIIDVGIHKVDNRLVGDVDPSALAISKAHTPVPGGVGPMTIAMLLENCFESWVYRHQISSSSNEDI